MRELAWFTTGVFTALTGLALALAYALSRRTL